MSLVEFDEWKEEFGVNDSKYSIEHYLMEQAFKAGQQSQQSKIELLEKELTETQAFLNNQNHIKQAKIDELQARVDEGLDEIKLLRAEKTELFRIATERGELLCVLKNYQSDDDFVFRINTADSKHAALVYKTLVEKNYTEQIKVSKFSEGEHGVFLINCGYFYFKKYPFSSPDYWWKAVRNLDSLPVWFSGSYEIFSCLKGNKDEN